MMAVELLFYGIDRLVSGAALIVDYMLTIAISIASGVDAVFSFLPKGAQEFKPGVEIAIAALLIF